MSAVRPIIGVLLVGGAGSRLWPLTRTTNKHLLPVGKMTNTRVDRSKDHLTQDIGQRVGAVMLDWPIRTLLRNGISVIHVVTGGSHMSDISRYLGHGESYPFVPAGCPVPDFHFTVQERAGGIAHALGLVRSAVPKDAVLVVILGDNMFYGEGMDDAVNEFVAEKDRGARIYGFETDNWKQFGVAELDDKGQVIRIVEKPQQFVSKIAVVGLYIYEADSVFEIIDTCVPSGRGELEISDVNEAYIAKGALDLRPVRGPWVDMGDCIETYVRANAILSMVEAGYEIKYATDLYDGMFNKRYELQLRWAGNTESSPPWSGE